MLSLSGGKLDRGSRRSVLLVQSCKRCRSLCSSRLRLGTKTSAATCGVQPDHAVVGAHRDLRGLWKGLGWLDMKYLKATTVPQEIQAWFQGELEGRGIDIVYCHTVMSLLLDPDKEPGNRGAAVECLRSATEQKCGLETLVDELCRRLNKHLHPQSDEPETEAAAAPPQEEAVKRRSPKELAQMYYAAFPALENSPQVQAQRVSWDGRRIIELHEREQQTMEGEGSDWESIQEQQLRSRLDDPNLAAIWGHQEPTLGDSIHDVFHSVWALSGEDKLMLKVLSGASCEGTESMLAKRS